MRVYFPYETKNRELDGKLLLTSHLLDKGYEVVIGSRKAIRTEALSQKNGLYFLKSVSVEEKKLYQRLKQNGHQIFLLHAEGGIHYKNNKSNILSAFNPELINLIDKNFVFGENIKHSVEILVNYYENIVSGEPRFDLLKPRFSVYFQKEVRVLKDKYQDFILINTNFGLSNAYVGEDKILKYYSTENTLSSKAKELLLYKLDFLKNVFHLYLEAIELISEKFPDINFVIRPHPSESEKPYLILAEKYKNIYVQKEGNVAKWIIGAKAVIHYDCTTGMESALAKTPVISYIPKKDDSILAWLPVALSHQVSDTKQLINQINKILNTPNYKDDISKEMKEEWLGYVHNVKHESSEIIMKELVKNYDLSKIKTENISLFDTIKLLYHRKRRDLKDLKDGLKKIKSITKDKFGAIKKQELIEKITILNRINNFNKPFKVIKLAHDLYKIKTK